MPKGYNFELGILPNKTAEYKVVVIGRHSSDLPNRLLAGIAKGKNFYVIDIMGLKLIE